MKQLNNLLIIALCVTVLGFFANWAQNDYGMQLIGYCMLVCSALLFTHAFLQLQSANAVKALYIFTMACYGFLIIFNSHKFPDVIFVSASTIALFFPIIIIPIAIKMSERKQEHKTDLFYYVVHVFLAMFCSGNYFKIYHLTGAGPLIVMSGFIVFPLITHALFEIKNGLKNKSINYFTSAFIHVFVGLDIVAFIFITQHWPGGKELIYTSFVFAWLAIFAFISGKFKIEMIKDRWNYLNFISKTAYFCFIIISAYYFLSRNNIAPKIYSNTLPPSLDELYAKENEITKEGKLFAKRKKVYETNYYNFLEHRQEAEEKSNGNIEN
jgi:hypothetical protein